jgi:hypothetical protein
MFAVLRDNTFDAAKRADSPDAVQAFRTAHAAQPGYRGSIVVDAEGGRELSITLWASRADAEAARVALGRVIGRTLGPLMAMPSTLVGLGEVAFNDLTSADPALAGRSARRKA